MNTTISSINRSVLTLLAAHQGLWVAQKKELRKLVVKFMYLTLSVRQLERWVIEYIRDQPTQGGKYQKLIDLVGIKRKFYAPIDFTSWIFEQNSMEHQNIADKLRLKDADINKVWLREATRSAFGIDSDVLQCMHNIKLQLQSHVVASKKAVIDYATRFVLKPYDVADSIMSSSVLTRPLDYELSLPLVSTLRSVIVIETQQKIKLLQSKEISDPSGGRISGIDHNYMDHNWKHVEELFKKLNSAGSSRLPWTFALLMKSMLVVIYVEARYDQFAIIEHEAVEIISTR